MQTQGPCPVSFDFSLRPQGLPWQVSDRVLLTQGRTVWVRVDPGGIRVESEAGPEFPRPTPQTDGGDWIPPRERGADRLLQTPERQTAAQTLVLLPEHAPSSSSQVLTAPALRSTFPMAPPSVPASTLPQRPSAPPPRLLSLLSPPPPPLSFPRSLAPTSHHLLRPSSLQTFTCLPDPAVSPPATPLLDTRVPCFSHRCPAAPLPLPCFPPPPGLRFPAPAPPVSFPLPSPRSFRAVSLSVFRAVCTQAAGSRRH